MNIYVRIKELLKKRGCSMQELEQACGISKGYVSKFKTVTPRIDTLQKIADFLGVSVEYLYGTDEIAYEPKSHTWEVEQQTSESTQPDGYYLYEQTRDFTDFLMHNPEYSVLFDASRKVKPDDIQKAVKMLGILTED